MTPYLPEPDPRADAIEAWIGAALLLVCALSGLAVFPAALFKVITG